MKAFLVLVRKLLVESRWFLGLTAAALFGLGWLTVFQTARIQAANAAGRTRGMGFMRFLGGPAMDFSSAAMEVAPWNHPIIPLLVTIWAIARGSAAVAGEVEKGTLDLVLSRPVARGTYLAAQVTNAVIGLMVLVAALVAGNLCANRWFPIEGPPSLIVLARPALNLIALGMAIFGYTFVVSAADNVRWRSSLFGSSLTLAGMVALVVAYAPGMEDWRWIERFSIFRAFAPVEAVVKGETLAFNVGLLASLAIAEVGLGFLAFQYRDLPANS